MDEVEARATEQERERCAGIVMGRLNWTDDAKLKNAFADLYMAILNDPEKAMARLNPSPQQQEMK